MGWIIWASQIEQDVPNWLLHDTYRNNHTLSTNIRYKSSTGPGSPTLTWSVYKCVSVWPLNPAESIWRKETVHCAMHTPPFPPSLPPSTPPKYPYSLIQWRTTQTPPWRCRTAVNVGPSHTASWQASLCSLPYEPREPTPSYEAAQYRPPLYVPPSSPESSLQGRRMVLVSDTTHSVKEYGLYLQVHN